MPQRETASAQPAGSRPSSADHVQTLERISQEQVWSRERSEARAVEIWRVESLIGRMVLEGRVDRMGPQHWTAVLLSVE